MMTYAVLITQYPREVLLLAWQLVRRPLLVRLARQMNPELAAASAVMKAPTTSAAR